MRVSRAAMWVAITRLWWRCVDAHRPGVSLGSVIGKASGDRE
jgi:hypothetical protein